MIGGFYSPVVFAPRRGRAISYRRLSGLGQTDSSIPAVEPGYVRTIESEVVVDTPIGPHGTSQIVDTPDTSPTGAGTGVAPGSIASGTAGGGTPGSVLFPGSNVSGTGLGPFPNIFGLNLPTANLPSLNLPNLPNACTAIFGNGPIAKTLCPYSFVILLAGSALVVFLLMKKR